MSLTQTQHCGYFIHEVGVTNLNIIFNVCGEKETAQPSKEQRYRLLSHKQHATETCLFVCILLDALLSQKLEIYSKKLK